MMIRLQTGMRGAWGKPYGTVARVNIGQILLSIRTKETNRAVVIEALRRARYKFPGRQKIIISKKWGFTNVNKEEYQKLKENKLVVQCVSSRAPSLLSSFFSNGVAYSYLFSLNRDGAYVQFIRPRGNLESNLKMQLRA